MLQQFDLQPAFVLHSRPYRETSLLLEVFSRDAGRVGLVARGARSSRSRWRNVLQPFRPLLLSWRHRGDLGTLTGAEQVASLPHAAGEAWFCALYVNELLLRSLQRGDPHSVLFEAYRQFLQRIFDDIRPQPLLRRFEAALLDSMGLGLELSVASDGSPIEPGGWYRFEPARGAVRIQADGDTTVAGKAWVVSGASLLALKTNDIGPEHEPELKRLMRSLLRYHLGDRPLVAQTLFNS